MSVKLEIGNDPDPAFIWGVKVTCDGCGHAVTVLIQPTPWPAVAVREGLRDAAELERIKRGPGGDLCPTCRARRALRATIGGAG